MGAKIQAFDIFQTPLSSHYPLPLTGNILFYSFFKSAYVFFTIYCFFAKQFCCWNIDFLQTLNFLKNETSFFQKPKSLNIETLQGGGGGSQSKLLSILTEAKGKQNYKNNVHRTVVFVLASADIGLCKPKVHIYLEYHSVCPLVWIGTHNPSPVCECALPSELKGGGRVAH